MREPEEVVAMLRLHRPGWGSKRIAAQLGCSRNTVKRYLRLGGWRASRMPPRSRKLAGLEAWLVERHRGNADVVRQELLAEHGIAVSLRTVERAAEPLRQQRRAQALATVRFETPPGAQMQIDFGERTVLIASERERVYVFVATLGYSRRLYVQAFQHERQASWFDGMESAFAAFGGATAEVLLDNACALVFWGYTPPVGYAPHEHPRNLQMLGQRKVLRPLAAPIWATTPGPPPIVTAGA